MKGLGDLLLSDRGSLCCSCSPGIPGRGSPEGSPSLGIQGIWGLIMEKDDMRVSNIPQILLSDAWIGLHEKGSLSQCETIQRLMVRRLPSRRGGGQGTSWGRGRSKRELIYLGDVTQQHSGDLWIRAPKGSSDLEPHNRKVLSYS